MIFYLLILTCKVAHSNVLNGTESPPTKSQQLQKKSLLSKKQVEKQTKKLLNTQGNNFRRELTKTTLSNPKNDFVEVNTIVILHSHCNLH